MGKTKADAREQLVKLGVPMGKDFHWLNSAYVELVIQAAKRHGYRKPKNANGSLARCFYEYCNR